MHVMCGKVIMCKDIKKAGGRLVMKFYNFSNYEYYALIGVSERETFPMDVALEAYMEEVA